MLASRFRLLPLRGWREVASRPFTRAPDPSPTRKNQFFSLQAGRGIAALMVVVFHATSFVGADPRYWHRVWLSEHLHGLALGVEFFFVLSGTVILFAHSRDIGHPTSIPTYLWKRFRRLYPIYWVVLTLLVAEYILRPQLGSASMRNPWVILSGYLLVYIHTWETNLPVAWTLFHEVLFYAVFVSILLSRRLGYAVIGLWTALSIAMLIHPLPRYYGAYLFSPLHLLFIAGMAVAWLLRRRTGYQVTVPLASALVVAGTTIFLAAIAWAGFYHDIKYSIELLAGSGAVLLILGSATLERAGRLHVPRSLNFLGDASYSVYLIHYPFYMYLAPLFYRASLHVRVPVAVPFVLMVVCATAVGSWFHLYVERPLLKWLSSPKTAKPAGNQPASTEPVTAEPLIS